MRNLTVGVLVLMTGCANHSQQQLSPGSDTGKPVNSSLECSIQPAKPYFTTDEPITIAVIIHNRNNHPVIAAFSGRDYPIVNFRLTDTSTPSSLLSTKKNLWDGTGSYNAPIPSGQEYRFSVN